MINIETLMMGRVYLNGLKNEDKI